MDDDLVIFAFRAGRGSRSGWYVGFREGKVLDAEARICWRRSRRRGA